MMPPKHLGRYEIIETLGRGAMGVVYKAHDPLIDRTVAIKTISYAGLTPAESEDFEQRFFLEAKSAGRLSHPNIVTIHDVGHSDDLAYIAMEFLVGKTLRDIIDSGVVLPSSRMARYAYSVADGLAFAHANNIVHRDIKPANIMVLDTGRVKIMDFGIALLPSGALTSSGIAIGSPKYMAPEQVLGHKADHRSDIFSLGAVLYELLTGFPPFDGEDINAILYKVLNDAPPLPSALNAALPPGFDRIVARALSKDPERRYQSAAEMATDLRNYKKLPGLLQAGNAADAQFPASRGRQKNLKPTLAQAPHAIGKARPHRAGVAVAAAALLLALSVSAAYWWRGWRDHVDASSGVQVANAGATRLAEPGASSTVSVAPAAADANGDATVAAEAHPQQALLPVAEANTPATEPTATGPTAIAPATSAVPPVEQTAAGVPTATPAAPAASSAPAPTATATATATSAPSHKAHSRKRPQKAIAKAEPPVTPPAPAPAPPRAEKPAAPDWRAQLKTKLASCESLSFFSRVICSEKAVWEYCPGHWGSPECPQGEPNQ